MRRPVYLSPTAMAKWRENRDEFYLSYLTDNRPPRIPQTQPMSIGSSFDAHVKSYLHEGLFGKGHDPRFELRTIFEAQVEPHNRDWAIKHGAHAFRVYKAAGALGDLMLELQAAVGAPRFELEIKGAVDGHREGVTKGIGGVTFLGKPDVFFIHKSGCYVILDWKVNGWCSSRTTSPMQGYCKLRTPVGTHGGPHKHCMMMMHNGMMINVAHMLEQLDDDWARQLSIYGWLCGMNVGQEFVTAIDQLVCSPTGLEFPLVRVAEHRLRVSGDHQWRVYAEAEELWEVVQSDWIFRDLSFEDSLKKCRVLDKQADALCGYGNSEDLLFAQMTTRRG